MRKEVRINALMQERQWGDKGRRQDRGLVVNYGVFSESSRREIA